MEVKAQDPLLIPALPFPLSSQLKKSLKLFSTFVYSLCSYKTEYIYIKISSCIHTSLFANYYNKKYEIFPFFVETSLKPIFNFYGCLHAWNFLR